MKAIKKEKDEKGKLKKALQYIRRLHGTRDHPDGREAGTILGYILPDKIPEK